MNPSDWLSFHLYYYDGLLPPILGFVRPVVIDLLQYDKIDRFFFIRYGLGGPHIRFRLQPLPGKDDEVRARVDRQAMEFLASTPSRSSLSREAVENSTRSILESDPHETDGTVYPDNTFMPVPFQPETNRYGGPELLAASLDFFSVSSMEALAFLDRHAATPRSRQLPWIFRLLFRQAVGFAANLNELNSLLGYAEISWGNLFGNIIEKADAVFEKQRDTFASLLEEEMRICLTASKEPTSRPVLLDAACLLGQVTRRLNPDRRWVIGGSQLHMTANRLLASNPEEVYLSRLLSRTWGHLQATKPLESALIGSSLDLTVPDPFEVTRWMKLKLTELT